jgi:bacterioferritin-associated ferredoxin
MNGCPRGADCSGCEMYSGGPVVCRCLQITEEQLVSAVTNFELRTIIDVRRFTGAGEGCTACHRKIQLYLDSYSSSSSPDICSAR